MKCNNYAIIHLLKISKSLTTIINFIQSETNYIFDTNFKDMNRKLFQIETLISSRDMKLKELQNLSSSTIKILNEIK